MIFTVVQSYVDTVHTVRIIIFFQIKKIIIWKNEEEKEEVMLEMME